MELTEYWEFEFKAPFTLNGHQLKTGDVALLSAQMCQYFQDAEIGVRVPGVPAVCYTPEREQVCGARHAVRGDWRCLDSPGHLVAGRMHGFPTGAWERW